VVLSANHLMTPKGGEKKELSPRKSITDDQAASVVEKKILSKRLKRSSENDLSASGGYVSCMDEYKPELQENQISFQCFKLKGRGQRNGGGKKWKAAKKNQKTTSGGRFGDHDAERKEKGDKTGQSRELIEDVREPSLGLPV